MEEEEEGHLLLAEGSFFTLCQVEHHHHYAEHEHYYYVLFFISGSRPTLLGFPSMRNFMIARYQKKKFQMLFLGLRRYLKCFSSQYVLLSLSLSNPTMGFPQVVRLRSTMSSWLLIDNDPA